MRERAVFIHSYLSATDQSGNPIPDHPTRACILAANELKRRGKVDTIALSVVGELAEPITKRVRTLLSSSLGENDLISTESTVTTKGEVEEIKRLAEEKGLEEVTSIVIDPHKKRVEENVRKIFGENQDTVTVKTFDEVLKAEREGLYAGIIKESKSWPLVRSFEKQEALVENFAKIPFGEWLLQDLPELLPDKLKIWLQKMFLRNL